MSFVTENWAAIEAEKARLRVVQKNATLHLAMLEILQSVGGTMKAIELVDRLIIRFEDFEKDPLVLCRQIGFEPDEVVGMAGLI